MVRRGDESGQIVQHARSVEQARILIEKVMLKPSFGYSYQIQTAN